MNTSRRTLLKASLAPLFFMAGTARAEEAALPDQPEIRIIQDKDPALLGWLKTFVHNAIGLNRPEALNAVNV